MKKHNRVKLSLVTETVRTLVGNDLGRVVGGLPKDTYWDCPTQEPSCGHTCQLPSCTN